MTHPTLPLRQNALEWWADGLQHRFLSWVGLIQLKAESLPDWGNTHSFAITVTLYTRSASKHAYSYYRDHHINPFVCQNLQRAPHLLCPHGVVCLLLERSFQVKVLRVVGRLCTRVANVALCIQALCNLHGMLGSHACEVQKCPLFTNPYKSRSCDRDYSMH